MKSIGNNDKISILIPMYNVEKYIGKCLKSVISQTYTNLEIIVLDDGSTDGSFEIAKQYAKKDDRIVLLQKQNEKNVSKTRNKLLENIKTKYFMFVDSDDVLSKKYVEKLYSALKEYDADLSACSFKINGLIGFNKYSSKPKVLENDDIISNMILSRQLHFVLWNKLYKTDLLKDVRFNEKLAFGEDLDFCYRYLKNAKKVVYIWDRLYNYRLRRNSIIHQKFNEKNVEFLNQLELLKEREQNEKDKNALIGWICYTSASFKYLMKRAKYTDKNLTKRLNENIEKYDEIFLNNSYVNWLFKKTYNVMKKIK